MRRMRHVFLVESMVSHADNDWENLRVYYTYQTPTTELVYKQPWRPLMFAKNSLKTGFTRKDIQYAVTLTAIGIGLLLYSAHSATNHSVLGVADPTTTVQAEKRLIEDESLVTSSVKDLLQTTTKELAHPTQKRGKHLAADVKAVLSTSSVFYDAIGDQKAKLAVKSAVSRVFDVVTVPPVRWQVVTFGNKHRRSTTQVRFAMELNKIVDDANRALWQRLSAIDQNTLALEQTKHRKQLMQSLPTLISRIVGIAAVGTGLLWNLLCFFGFSQHCRGTCKVTECKQCRRTLANAVTRLPAL